MVRISAAAAWCESLLRSRLARLAEVLPLVDAALRVLVFLPHMVQRLGEVMSCDTLSGWVW